VINIHLYNSKLKAGDTMKVKLFWIALAMMLCCSAIYAGSTTVLGEAGSIFGASGEKFSFVSDQTPLVHRVALTDMEFKAAFDSLGVAMTTSTDNLRELLAPGMAISKAAQGKTYFANALGAAADISRLIRFIRYSYCSGSTALCIISVGHRNPRPGCIEKKELAPNSTAGNQLPGWSACCCTQPAEQIANPVRADRKKSDSRKGCPDGRPFLCPHYFRHFACRCE
jgi:hypothetical protein